ncbi:MAG: hypothetical protein K8W52_43570 [Deltaproteobacteria bacterium]|nr:hypothetical protein [Deltaproteobacteria bacterium]
MRLSHLSIALALVTTATVARADAPARPSTPLELHVELTDAGASAPAFDGTVPLDTDHACASISASSPQGVFEAKLCRNASDAQSATVDIEVNRTSGTGAAMVRQRWTSTARIALGKRAVIGRIATGGAATEVAVTAK